MANWKDAIRSHGASTAIESLREELLNEGSFNDKDTDAFIARFVSILERATKLLSGADDTYLPKQALSTILGNINSIRPPLEQLRAQRTTVTLHDQYIDQMEPYIDQILLTLAQIRSITTPITKESAFDKLGNIKLDAEAKIREIESVLRADVEDISDEIAEAQEKSTALATSISEEKTRADSLITQFQSEFNSGQKERDEKFQNKLEKDYSPKLNSKLKEIQSGFNDLNNKIDHKVAEFDASAERIIQTLEGHVNKAGLVAQAIAKKAIRTEYENNAELEKKEARKWSYITLIVCVLMVFFVTGVLFLMLLGEKPISTETVVPKLILTAILVGVARWTAKLERSHTEEARRYKQLSLELETISPFIATLPEAEQQEITRKLVDRYFVDRNHEVRGASEDDDSFKHPAAHVGDVIKSLVGKE